MELELWRWSCFNRTESNAYLSRKLGTYIVNLTASNGNGTDSKLATITVLQKPVYAYIANMGSNTISVIDTATNKVTTTIPVGTGSLRGCSQFGWKKGIRGEYMIATLSL